MSTKVTKKQDSAPQLYTRDQVPAMIAQLKQQLKDLKGNCEEKSSTNGKFEGLELKNCTVEELAVISAKVTLRTEGMVQEYKRHGLKEHPPIKIEGYTANQWYTDIKEAMFISVNKQKITQIETAIKKLEPHLGEDEKLARTMASIMEMAVAPIK